MVRFLVRSLNLFSNLPNSVSIIEELLGRNSSGSGLESLEYGRRDPSRLPRCTFYLQKLALTSRTQATKFSLVFICLILPAAQWPCGLLSL
jgi:hypothetical protein